MSDVQISPTGWTSLATSLANRSCVWVTDQIGYVFFYRSDDATRGSLWFAKTTDGGQTWTKMPIEGQIRALVSDGTYIYAGISQAPAVVVKIDPATMNSVDVWVGTASQQYVAALAWDGTYVYAGGNNASGVAIVVQINPATMATVATWTGTAAQLYCQAVVASGGFIFAGTSDIPAHVIKINPATMTTAGAPNTWTGAAGQDNCFALASDGTYIYAGLLNPIPAQVVQINPATMATVLTWTGAAGQTGCSALTYKSPYIYAVVVTNPAQVVQITTATMVTNATWVGAAGQTTPWAAVSDASYVYTGTRTSPAQVTQIDPATMTTVLTWTGATGQNKCFALTINGAAIYTGLDTSPGQVPQIDPATMTTTATWTGHNQKVNSEAVASNTAYAFSCWFDKWTPGDAGTKIHISWMDVSGGTSAAIVKYRALDTSNDTFGSQITVASGLSISVAASSVSGITKARGGYLYILRRNDGSNTFYRSITSGATWSGRIAPTVTNPTAQPCLTPGNEADNQDIYGVWAEGASLKLQFYDDSANTWTTTTIVALGETLSADIWAASTRKSDNHTIVVARVVNGANKDLKIYDVSAGTTFTTLTDVYTNEANHGNSGVGILITPTGTIYVDYAGIVGTTTAVAYKKSTDGGVTWSSVTRLDTAAAASTVVELALNQPPAPAGARLYGMWQETLVKGNYGNSVPLVAAAPAGSIVPLSPVFLG